MGVGGNKVVFLRYKTYLSISYSGMEAAKQNEFAQTGLGHDLVEREHDDELPYSHAQQVDHICHNLKFYVSLLIKDMIPVAEIEQLKDLLSQQLSIINSDFLHTEPVQRFETIITNHECREMEGYKAFANIDEFGNLIKKLIERRENIENEEEFEKTNTVIDGFIKEMQIIIQEDNYTLGRLEDYEVYGNNIGGPVVSNDKEVEELQPTHFWKQEKIIFTSELPPQVFEWVDPVLHRTYLSEVTKVYHEVVPFKIKHVCLSSLDDPVIDTPNYFAADLEPEKTIISYCKPGTRTMYSYRMDDICKLLTIEK